MPARPPRDNPVDRHVADDRSADRRDGLRADDGSDGADHDAWGRELERRRRMMIAQETPGILDRIDDALSNVGTLGWGPRASRQALDAITEISDAVAEDTHRQRHDAYCTDATDDAADDARGPAAWARRLERDRRSMLVMEPGILPGPGAAARADADASPSPNIIAALREIQKVADEYKLYTEPRKTTVQTAPGVWWLLFIPNIATYHYLKGMTDEKLRTLGRRVQVAWATIKKHPIAKKIPPFYKIIIEVVTRLAPKLPTIETMILVFIDTIIGFLLLEFIVMLYFAYCYSTPSCLAELGILLAK